ncbi:MAG: LCP family protein, partial [Acidimicrobiales bacterium]
RLRWVSAVIALMALALAGFGLTAWYMWTQVETIDTAGSLSAPSGGFTNYLIVGVDSRDGADPTLDTAAQIGLGVAGSRSDTMVVLHTGDDGNRLVSLPRDLWVAIDGGPQQAKLNAATASQNGPAALIRTVQSELRIPIHHYLEVDIAGFLSVVDALGGITLDFPAPTCDPKSGLDVRETGAVALSPEQALAYVRSRTYTEFDVNGTAGLSCAQIRSAGLGTVVGNADFGRTERQRLFLLAVFDKISSTRNPVTLLRVLSGLTDGLRVDDTMGMRDAFGLMRKLRGLNAETLSLPVSDFAAPGGASALTLNDSSAAVLDLFR